LTLAPQARFGTLRDELTAAMEDPARLAQALLDLGDDLLEWLGAAYHELRRMLERGDLHGSEALGDLIGAVLEARADNAGEPHTDADQHRATLAALNDGIGAVLDGDLAKAKRSLEPIFIATNMPASVRWIAAIWLTNVLAEEGDRRAALSQSRDALEIAQDIDEQTRATSLCKLAELYHAAGLGERSVKYLSEAVEVYRAAEDELGLAAAHLSKARILSSMDEDEAALEELELAQQARPDWEAPHLFRAWRALGAGEVETARTFVAELKENETSRERGQVLEIAELLKAGAADGAAVRELLRLRELPPSEKANEALAALVERAPGLLHARDMIAWRLLRAGQTEQAEAHFNQLVEEHPPLGLKTSAVLGLGLIANRNSLSQQPGARMYAAKAAGYKALVRMDEGVKPAQEDKEEEIEIEIDIDIDIDVELDGGSSPAPPRPQMSAGSAIDGDLQHFRITDLIDFLYRSRRSGTLVVTSVHGIAALHLRRGNITGATSPGCKNIGDILLEEEVISSDMLAEAAEYQRESSATQLLGAIFVERFGIETERVRIALRVQIQSAVKEIVTWNEGRFAFDPDGSASAPADATLDVEVDTLGVLLEAARIRDEENRR